MIKKAASIVLILVAALMSGCWDARNIDDLDICTAVVVDYKDGEYTLYFEIINIATNKMSGENTGQGLSTAIVQGAGESFAKARTEVDRELNKPVYLGAVQSLIMTEEMADNGIEEYAYRVREMTEYRKTMDMIITPDDPEDILNIRPENSATVGFAIEDTLQNLLEKGVIFHMSLADVLQKLSAHNKCYLLSTVGVKKEQIVHLGYTVFNGGYRIGFIPYEQSRGILYVTLGGEKRTPIFLYVVKIDDAVYTLETTLKNFSVKAKWDGTRASFDIDMDFEAKTLYQSVSNKTTPEIMRQIKADLSNQLMEDVTQAIQTSMDYESDYMNFSEPFRITYPGVYEQMEWQSTFVNADFTVDLAVALKEHEAYDYCQ
jgi:Ger(x)C family germination protein